MEAEASTSTKRVKKSALSRNEKQIVLNVYNTLRKENSQKPVDEVIKICANMTGVSKSTVYRIRRLQRAEGSLREPKPHTGRPSLIIADDVKYAIRRKVHSFFYKNEIPTLNKILDEIRKDDTLPDIRRTKLWRTLHELQFRFAKRNRKSYLIDRDEIIIWRRNYIRSIRDYRQQGRNIYYLDETWLNEGHTVERVWQDESIKSKRQAFVEGVTTGLKNPTGKGRRLIITHIGSKDGFLADALLTFVSKKTGDYHEEMNAEVFEGWFSTKVLTKLPPEAVVVMDNAPYHSRKVERLPSTTWRKVAIMEWLTAKNINYEETMVKAELLQLVKANKTDYTKYVVDEIAAERGVTILRLPPYHCELNPIELIWAQIKHEVARENTTFKLPDVEKLLVNAISQVDATTWQNCIQHVIKVESDMWDMDFKIDKLLEPLIITTGDDDDDDDDNDDDSDFILSDESDD